MRISDWSSDVCASDLRQIAVAERLLRVKEAEDNLITFTEMSMPHPEDPDDPQRSRYEAQYFHRALAPALEEVESGRMPRLFITFPPRHGQSELSRRRFPLWFVGRDPYSHLMVANYKHPFAKYFCRNV